MNIRFYIFSTGRCGTSYLSNLFHRLLPNVENLHQDEFSKLLNTWGNFSIISELSRKKLIRFINKLYDHDLPTSTIDPLRSIPYSLYFEQENSFNEPMILIHLMRDPRNFVTSFMNWKNRKFSGLVAHHIVPFWMPPSYLDENMTIIESLSITKFEHFCWIWQFKNDMFANFFCNKPNYHLFKFEDIMTSIKRLNEFLNVCGINVTLGPEVQDKRINRSEKTFFPDWKHWTSEQANVLDKYCGDLMHEYGYGLEEEWVEKID